MLDLASDDVLTASWLLRFRQPVGLALPLAAGKGSHKTGRQDAVFLRLLKMGVAATKQDFGLAIKFNLLQSVQYLWSRMSDASDAVDALCEVARYGQAACLQFMLTNRAHLDCELVDLVNQRGSYTWAPLHWAVSYASASSHVVEVVEMLLSAGALCSVQVRFMGNALHVLVSKPGEEATRVQIMRLLLQTQDGKGVIDEISDDGDTPLHLAALHNQPGCVEELARAGCALELRDSDGDTTYVIAGRMGYTVIQGICVDFGAEPLWFASDEDEDHFNTSDEEDDLAGGVYGLQEQEE